MKMFLTFCILLALIIFSNSCKESMSDTDRQEAQKGFHSQEIKKVLEADIISAGLDRGNTIANKVQQILGMTLKTKIEDEGIEAALKYCNLNAYPIVDSLSIAYAAQIRRVSQKNRNPRNYPDSVETVFLEAYQYSIDQGGQVSENIQEIDDDYLLYTRPILIGDPLCLKCHGELQVDITTGTEKLIKELYPDDRATGFRIGKLRGMWSIRLEKKEIINSL